MLETPNTTTKARLRIVLVDRVIAVGHLQGFTTSRHASAQQGLVHRVGGNQADEVRLFQISQVS